MVAVLDSVYLCTFVPYGEVLTITSLSASCVPFSHYMLTFHARLSVVFPFSSTEPV